MKDVLYKEKGIVLPIVVMMVSIVTLLGFTAVYMVNSQNTLGQHYTGGEDALYYAESGVNKALWYLHDDPLYYKSTQTETADIQNGRYQFQLQPPDEDDPMVTVTSTGWSIDKPNIRRTIKVELRKRQFVQNMYSSGVEETADGSTVYWIDGDEVNGPLHTNGTINIDGDPIFHGMVTYAGGDPNIRSGSDPQFLGGGPERVDPMVFPPNNNNLKEWAERDGYNFTGRTCILLDDNMLKIRNPNINGGKTVTRNLPPNGVIYVGGSGTRKWDLDTGNVFVSGTLNGRLTIAAENDIYIAAYDPTNFSGIPSSTEGIKYSNNNFDPGGTVTDDMLGLVANGYVRILHYGYPGDRGGRRTNRDVAPENITIHAAVFALDWSFEFEDHDEEPEKGDINLVGSIAQNYRGAVGVFGTVRVWDFWPIFWHWETRRTGYNKKYTHDVRMNYDSPPHFLEPENAGWEIVNWRQVTNP